jgi:polyhydroxyalkanoate synthesis regulator phasin
MTRRDAEDLLSRLRQMSEEGVSSFLSEVFSNERMRQGFGRAGKRFLENKRILEHNLETVLDFVSIPSKKDIRELKARLDHLSSQLVNLSIKIDRLLAKQSPRPTGGPSKPVSRRRGMKPAE